MIFKNVRQTPDESKSLSCLLLFICFSAFEVNKVYYNTIYYLSGFRANL